MLTRWSTIFCVVVCSTILSACAGHWNAGQLPGSGTTSAQGAFALSDHSLGSRSGDDAGLVCVMRSGWWAPLKTPMSITNAAGVFGALQWGGAPNARAWTVHTGVDLAAKSAPVYPARPGNILQTRSHEGYGNTIVMTHLGDTVQSLYAHLNWDYRVRVHEHIGEHTTRIGTTGCTGTCEGGPPHMHFELSQNGPLVIPSGPNKGQIMHDYVADPCGSNDTASFVVSVVGAVTATGASIDGTPLSSVGPNAFASGPISIGVHQSGVQRPQILGHVLKISTQDPSTDGLGYNVLINGSNEPESAGAVFLANSESEPQSVDNLPDDQHLVSKLIVAFVSPGVHTLHSPVSIAVNQAPWQDSGVNLKPHANYTVVASGLMNYWTGGCQASPNCIVTPDGQTCAFTGFFAQGLACWSLIGSIGPAGKPFQLGSRVSFPSGSGGELYLGVNDTYYGDNSGHWTATICDQATNDKCPK